MRCSIVFRGATDQRMEAEDEARPLPDDGQLAQALGLWSLFFDIIGSRFSTPRQIVPEMGSTIGGLPLRETKSNATGNTTSLSIALACLFIFIPNSMVRLKLWSAPRLIFKRNYCRKPEDDLTYAELFASRYLEDRERVIQAMQVAIQEQTVYRLEHRVLWPDGSLHWISASGRLITREEGTPPQMAGISLGLTIKHIAELVCT